MKAFRMSEKTVKHIDDDDLFEAFRIILVELWERTARRIVQNSNQTAEEPK